MLKPLIALPCAALLTIGCRAAPAPDSGFLKQPALMANDESLPFNRVWFNPKYRNQAYSELYVAPVNTDYIMAENIWEKASVANISQDNVKQNVEMLAEYQRSEILKAVQNYPKNTFKIVAKPGPNTLILEVALSATCAEQVSIAGCKLLLLDCHRRNVRRQFGDQFAG